MDNQIVYLEEKASLSDRFHEKLTRWMFTLLDSDKSRIRNVLNKMHHCPSKNRSSKEWRCEECDLIVYIESDCLLINPPHSSLIAYFLPSSEQQTRAFASHIKDYILCCNGRVDEDELSKIVHSNF